MAYISSLYSGKLKRRIAMLMKVWSFLKGTFGLIPKFIEFLKSSPDGNQQKIINDSSTINNQNIGQSQTNIQNQSNVQNHYTVVNNYTIPLSELSDHVDGAISRKMHIHEAPDILDHLDSKSSLHLPTIKLVKDGQRDKGSE